MAELNSKVREALALLYEYPEFKALEIWNKTKRSSFADQILKVDMSSEGSSERVAFLQGQAYAHELMLLELRKIHKKQSADASAN